MKSLKSVLIITLIICMNYSFGQGSTSIDVATERLYMNSDASREVSALGSAYIDEKFMPAKIKRYKNALFFGRFNAYNGELQIDLGNDKIIALDVNNDYEVMFTATNKTYKSVSYTTENGINKRGFLVVINEGTNSTLYKKETISYIDAIPAATSYQRDKPAKFDREDDQYYLSINGVVSYLPLKKKDLLKKFPKNAKEINSYIKENDLNLKDENELIQVVSHLSTL